MRNVQVHEDKIQHQVDKRQMFHVGLFLHFTAFVVANVIVWAIWLVLPNKGDGLPAIPLIVTGAWAIILIAHGLIVSVSHSPRQVRQDEIKRQVQKDSLKGR